MLLCIFYHKKKGKNLKYSDRDHLNIQGFTVSFIQQVLTKDLTTGYIGFSPKIHLGTAMLLNEKSTHARTLKSNHDNPGSATSRHIT